MASSDLVAGVEALLGTRVVAARPVSGGCISDGHRVELADGRVVFAKSGAGLPDGLLAVEAEGLGWLREAHAIRVPEVVAVGSADSGRRVDADSAEPRALADPRAGTEQAGAAGTEPGRTATGDAAEQRARSEPRRPELGGAHVLVLEWIETGTTPPGTAERLGRGLARLHAHGAPGFGWRRDGFIGSLPQRNTPVEPASDPGAWPRFWFTRRIEPLARMAHDQRALAPAAAALVARLGSRLAQRAGPPEPPARVHGDLWSGNVMTDHQGEPWVVDPAPYGGHREVDLAMLHLFGRPAPATLAAYEEVAPLASGWRERLALWQLEPLLVHTVLFGGGYGAQAHDILRRFA